MNPTAKRLIDANELRSKACSAMLEIANTPLPNEYSSKLVLKMGEMFQKLIDDAPTVEVEPVRRGWWEHLGGDEWCCSYCGSVIHTEGSWEKPTKRYCFDCGARMDGEGYATD